MAGDEFGSISGICQWIYTCYTSKEIKGIKKDEKCKM